MIDGFLFKPGTLDRLSPGDKDQRMLGDQVGDRMSWNDILQQQSQENDI